MVKDEIANLIIAIGGWGVLIIGLSTGIYKLLQQRLQKKYDADIEDLKSKNSLNNSLINSLTNSISSVYLASTEKRVDYLEKTWIAMLELKQQYPTNINLLYTLFTKEEVETMDLTQNKLFINQLKKISIENYQDLTHSLVDKINLSRPFIGNDLWLTFFAYQAFLGRIAFNTTMNIGEGKLEFWTKDKKYLDSILKTVIPEKHLIILLKDDISAFNNILNYLESKALNNIYEQLSGRQLSNENLNQAIKLSEVNTPSNEKQKKALYSSSSQ